MSMFQWVQQLGVWAQLHQTLCLWVVGGGMGLMVVVNLLWRRRGLQLTTHGSARWATPREVARGDFSTTHGIVMGEVNGTVYCDDGSTHDALFGPTRSGKGNFHLKPTLRWFWRESALITDPKNGENYLATAANRRQYGRVEVFAPYALPQCCLNVGDTIRWGDPREFDDALTIGQSLTAPRKMARESDVSLPFRELAAMLLAAVQLHLGYANGGHCSLPMAWRFLTQRRAKKRGAKLLETLDLM